MNLSVLAAFTLAVLSSVFCHEYKVTADNLQKKVLTNPHRLEAIKNLRPVEVPIEDHIRMTQKSIKLMLPTTERAQCPSPAYYSCCNYKGCILYNSSGSQIASVAYPCAIVKSTSSGPFRCIGKYGCSCSASARCAGSTVTPYNCFNAYP